MTRSLSYTVLGLGFGLFLLNACSQIPVQTSVDSSGEIAGGNTAAKNQVFYFESVDRVADDFQTLKECRRAAQFLGFNTADQKCPQCTRVVIKTKVSSADPVVTSAPRLMSSGGMFGDERSIGNGLANRESIRSSAQANREIDLTIFPYNGDVKASREIAVRSTGSGAQISAVAFEMCEAAFKDYPENLSGRRYDIKR